MAAGGAVSSASGGKLAPSSTAAAARPLSPWLAANPSKRWAELFYLAYSPFWILWALCVLVPLQLFEHCGNTGYMLIGLCAATPTVVLPLVLPNKADEGKPWGQQYWVKATVWIAVFSYVGNYFWTHYFFKVLGAAYTFKSWRLNEVPITLYLMTQAYFCFYHALSNVLLRRVRWQFRGSSALVRRTAMGLMVFALAYATAYGETLTIAHFPYYTFVDRSKMYSVGSLFYAIYFFVSFPWFFIMDEDVNLGATAAAGPAAAGGKVKAGAKRPVRAPWTVGQAATDALAASMLVTILLDLWRIAAGPVVPPEHVLHKGGTLPWL